MVVVSSAMAPVARGFVRLLMVGVLAWVAGGCQSAHTAVVNRSLVAHLPGIDFSGLDSMKRIDELKIDCSLPENWVMNPPNRSALFLHEQWKSPSHHTGVGILHVNLPLPLSAQTLLWFAKIEYAKNGSGREVGQWTDSLGRPWFEGENDKYHIRGYAIVDGLDAWIIYMGYKVKYPPVPSELSLAARSIDSAVPAKAPALHREPAVASE